MKDQLTQFDAIPTEPESGKHHLTPTNQHESAVPNTKRVSAGSQSEFRSKSREVADWCDTDEVEEEDDKHSICTTKVECALSQKSQSETRHDHLWLTLDDGALSECQDGPYVRRQPHRRNIQQRLEPSIGALVFRHALDTSLFNLELAGKALCSGIPPVANLEALARNGIVVGNDTSLSISVDLVEMGPVFIERLLSRCALLDVMGVVVVLPANARLCVVT
jgi:hypothetical protein